MLIKVRRNHFTTMWHLGCPYPINRHITRFMWQTCWCLNVNMSYRYGPKVRLILDINVGCGRNEDMRVSLPLHSTSSSQSLCCVFLKIHVAMTDEVRCSPESRSRTWHEIALFYKPANPPHMRDAARCLEVNFHKRHGRAAAVKDTFTLRT
jgi:hypothetical protein